MQKLKLNKEVIATLSDDGMNRVQGGGDSVNCDYCSGGGSTCDSFGTCGCLVSVRLSNCPLCNPTTTV